MTLFQFTAVREGGKEVFSGEREAPDKRTLIETLRGEGIVALSAEIVQTKRRLSSFNVNLHIPFLSGIGTAQKIIFARNLAAMIRAGLPLSRAIDVLARQSKGKALRAVMDSLGEDVRQGVPLHSALARQASVFPPLFVALARAGEESGTLSDALSTAGLQMEKSYALRKKIRGAMIYPSIVIAVMLGVFVLMLVYVVPQLSATFASLGSKLPLPTQMVLGASTFVLNNLLLLSAALIALIVGMIVLLRTTQGRMLWDRGILWLPIVGRIVIKANCARTARTLGSLLKAGVSSLVALEITMEAVPNTQFKGVVANARGAVEKGAPLSQAFLQAKQIYPPMFSEMAAVGEETGDTPAMLARVADFYEAEVDEETKDISTIIEPVLMLVIGAGVGFFAIAMIAPIYSLSSAV